MSPIRPENRGRYPADWRAIRERVINRSRHSAFPRCECRGECGHDHRRDYEDFVDVATRRRCGEFDGADARTFRGQVVLTVAHLDHTPENCDLTNLRAMCQRCHNAYDAEHRRATRRAREARERAEAGQLQLAAAERADV